MIKIQESGRSMVEMLGVLAIIGVLSVGGIYGYTVAMRSNRINEIIHGASMLNAMGQALNEGQGDGTLDYDDLFSDLPKGVENMVYDNHNITVEMEDNNQDDCLFLTNKMGDAIRVKSPCTLGQVTFQFKNTGSDGANNGGSGSGEDNDIYDTPPTGSCQDGMTYLYQNPNSPDTCVVYTCSGSDWNQGNNTPLPCESV